MDVDCLVLKPLADGFSVDKPIAIGRWPTPNMGVMFLNTTLDWPFVDFFDEFTERAIERCQRVMKKPDAINDSGDQRIMVEMLQARPQDVERIQCREWNFTYTRATPGHLVREWRDRIRVVHLHIKSWGCSVRNLQDIRHHFPEAFPGAA
jgi:hypothetical protein